MKNLLKLVLALAVILPTFAFANVTCTAVELDTKISYYPNIIPMTEVPQQFGQYFKADFKGNKFSVVINPAENLYASITTAEGVEFDVKGSFNDNGTFEFSQMAGGNVMYPETMLAISCQR